MRSKGMMGGQDQMMDEFAQQPGQIPGAPPQPFAMEHLRRELDQFQTTPPRTGSPGWAAEFDPGEQARMEAAFAGPQGPMMNNGSGFTPAEFARFQQQSRAGVPQTANPVTSGPSPMMSGFQRPMGMGYMGMGGMGGMGMMHSAYNPMAMQQQPAEATTQDKGKGRMVELDDENWEAQFAEMETADTQKLDDEANDAIEAELNDLDRSVFTSSTSKEADYDAFENVWQKVQAETAASRKLAEEDTEFNVTDSLHMGDMGEWDNFDSLNTRFRDPQLGDYMFEDENMFKNVTNPFEEGVKLMREGGNLSLAALAFEAAVQKDPQHVQAWTMLGSAQAQNEKELPAIRALEQALKVDPNNLDALMGLAVSYTNEGYDSTAYRTLERWLSVKYPQIINPKDLSSDADLGFTDRQILHDRVTDFFIQAAQLSPSGAQMDPDVQVGLGVLFYCAEEYDKAVDCFSAALASTESGTVNQREQLHLLWNRLGATLANSGRSEEAIEAYEQALNINANFVRARYNLGVSCINIGCYPEAAQHLLGALSMHRVVEQEGRERAREIIGGDGVDDEQLERMIHISQNQSTNLYDTLRRVFSQMGRRDLADMVVAGMDVNASDVRPVDVPGSLSYTVICTRTQGQDEDPQESIIMSFRESASGLDEDMVRLARAIHGCPVPHMRNHGVMKGSDPPLNIYTMPLLPGVACLETLSCQADMGHDEEAKHIRFIKHLARPSGTEFWTVSGIEDDSDVYQDNIRSMAETAAKLGAILRYAFNRRADGGPSEVLSTSDAMLGMLKAWLDGKATE
ncbi:unnamed protein product [Aspergillus oryzae]|nr:unnamed protein product [Aspergillus oryzae]